MRKVFARPRDLDQRLAPRSCSRPPRSLPPSSLSVAVAERRPLPRSMRLSSPPSRRAPGAGCSCTRAACTGSCAGEIAEDARGLRGRAAARLERLQDRVALEILDGRAGDRRQRRRRCSAGTSDGGQVAHARSAARRRGRPRARSRSRARARCPASRSREHRERLAR